MSKTAIVLGASGLVGNEVLYALLNDADFSSIKIFIRKPLPIEHPKLEQHIINFNVIGNYSGLITGDVIFCCLGTTIKTAGSKEAFRKVDYTYPLEFARIAKQNGVKTFMLTSSLGADKSSSNFYLKVKGEVEETLKQLEFNTLITLRPSMLLGNRKEFRLGEYIGKIIMKGLGFLFVGGLKKYKAVEAGVVAKAMVKLSKSGLPGFNMFESDKLQAIGK